MQPIQDWLRGKKTYIVAAIGVLTAVGLYADGKTGIVATVYAVLSAVGLSTLRAAISKVLEKL